MKTSNDEILRAALTGYQLQADRISAKIAEIQATLTPRRGRNPSAKANPVKQVHKMSEAGRNAIRLAVRKRWAKLHAAKRKAA